MKRVLFARLLTLGVLVFGAFAASASASTDVLPGGVRVAGVRVGGLTPDAAVTALHQAFARPLVVAVDGQVYRLDPSRFASAYTRSAVARAQSAPAGATVKLVVAVDGAALRDWVASAATRSNRKGHGGSLVVRNGNPVVAGGKPGRALDTALLTQKLVAALTGSSRLPIRVHTRALAPSLIPADTRSFIVINRSLNRLSLFHGTMLVRRFAVATGQAIYPTPIGQFTIVVKQLNPWWYPPTYDSWARGLKPVPPGPGNPLGTRWMGLSAPGVGIHGTDNPGSIGYSVSHGCIRMQVPDAEWLFGRVDVGTPVFIV